MLASEKCIDLLLEYGRCCCSHSLKHLPQVFADILVHVRANKKPQIMRNHILLMWSGSHHLCLWQKLIALPIDETVHFGRAKWICTRENCNSNYCYLALLISHSPSLFFWLVSFSHVKIYSTHMCLASCVLAIEWKSFHSYVAHYGRIVQDACRRVYSVHPLTLCRLIKPLETSWLYTCMLLDTSTIWTEPVLSNLLTAFAFYMSITF